MVIWSRRYIWISHQIAATATIITFYWVNTSIYTTATIITSYSINIGKGKPTSTVITLYQVSTNTLLPHLLHFIKINKLNKNADSAATIIGFYQINRNNTTTIIALNQLNTETTTNITVYQIHVKTTHRTMSYNQIITDTARIMWFDHKNSNTSAIMKAFLGNGREEVCC